MTGRKKDAAIDAIIDATGLLIRERMGAPGAREIATKSGYAVGTIYNYFSSVGAVVSHLVHKRRAAAITRIASVIDRHDANDPLDLLAARVIDSFFQSFAGVSPSVMRFAYNMAREHSEKAEELGMLCDRLVPHLMAACVRDRTGTFRALNEQETLVFIRGVVYLICFPMLEGSALFATPTHKSLIQDYMTKIFAANLSAPTVTPKN